MFAASPRLLVLLEPGFNGDEFFGPSAVFRAAGYELVVASSREETVPLRLNLEPDSHWDVPVDLALADVNPDDYVGLYVPGGHSPGFLETDEDAVRIVRAFLETGKPLGMVCHGPRILLSNNLMGDRVWTGLFTLPDELADIWVERPGRYLDRAVVRDGNLLTARYPRDMDVFSWAFLELLAEQGGLEPQPLKGNVVLILSNHSERWGNWHFFSRVMTAVQAFGVEIQRVGGNNPEWISRVLGEMGDREDAHHILALDVNPEDWENVPQTLRDLALSHPRLVAGEGMRDLLAERDGPAVWLEERHIFPWVKAISGLAREAAENAKRFDPTPPPFPELPERAEVDAPGVFVAVREGFDDEALAAWVRALQDAGRGDIAFVARETGEVVGRNGLTVRATLAHDEVDPSDGQWVVAPGYFWPRLNPGARQAEQPEWLAAQEERDAERVAWLLASRENGAVLFLTGLDALRVGRMEAFHGTRFSSSAQTVWSFGRDGARYTDAPVTLSAERLVTVRGAADAPEALVLAGALE